MLTTGSWFHFLTIIILTWTGLFTLPRVYLNNQVILVSPLMNDAPPHPSNTFYWEQKQPCGLRIT